MSLVNHTLRAVKITKSIFELRKINRDIEEVSKIMDTLQQKREALESSFGDCI
jgi:vacuolar-type H+-ATPase subunit D/Vma8